MGGSCCGGDEKKDMDANLMGKGGSRNPRTDKNYMKSIPIVNVIRIQALIRGFLARRRV
jgi:hypothetical protein